jgi:hypothetical protein
MLEIHVIVSKGCARAGLADKPRRAKWRRVRFLFLFGSASIACPQNTGKLRRAAARRSGIRHWLQDACAFYEHCAMSSRRLLCAA